MGPLRIRAHCALNYPIEINSPYIYAFRFLGGNNFVASYV